MAFLRMTSRRRLASLYIMRMCCSDHLGSTLSSLMVFKILPAMCHSCNSEDVRISDHLQMSTVSQHRTSVSLWPYLTESLFCPCPVRSEVDGCAVAPYVLTTQGKHGGYEAAEDIQCFDWLKSISQISVCARLRTPRRAVGMMSSVPVVDITGGGCELTMVECRRCWRIASKFKRLCRRHHCQRWKYSSVTIPVDN
jgi:hypothetical protein